MSNKVPVLELAGIKRWYGQGTGKVKVLDGLDLTLHAGEAVAIVGPSGSGKSTLLHVAGLLDKPNAGTVKVAGKNTHGLPDAALSRMRNQSMGFVYQHHHLLREFSALENVMMPGRIGLSDNGMKGLTERAAALLEQVGLKHRMEHYPSQLSGGEQQRVAIARALMNKPAVLLADEPTGNLDPHTAESVTELLFRLIKQEGMAALIVTHNMELAGRCKRVVRVG
ncbi:MAG: ABC transporter ATP-binding protein [Pseudomonadaceae bacterium]|nr:ABC transporter ATP-binding protein [Pseudomonadaceae bacterium]